MALVGCRSLSVSELRRKFETPEYIQRVECGHHRIEVRYIHRTLRILERSGIEDGARLTQAALDSLGKSDSSRGLLFLLSIKPLEDSAASDSFEDVIYGGKSGFADYWEALEAFQSGFRDRIWIEHAGKRYPVGNYHLENTFGLTRGRNIVLTFNPSPNPGGQEAGPYYLVLDNLVPGLSRRKMEWTLPVGRYDEKI